MCLFGCVFLAFRCLGLFSIYVCMCVCVYIHTHTHTHTYIKSTVAGMNFGVYVRHIAIVVGGDSLVGIATRCGLNGPGSNSCGGEIFSAPVQTSPWTQPASYTIGIGSISRV